MEGDEYLTINPEMLSNVNAWSYRDLQKLSKKVGLSSKGKRDELVENLCLWHRCRIDAKTLVSIIDVGNDHNEEILEMNVCGNNFAMLALTAINDTSSTIASKNTSSVFDSSVYKKASSTSATVSSRKGNRNSISLVDVDKEKSYEQSMIVSPTYLRPLTIISGKVCTAVDGSDVVTSTPGKSILKQTNNNSKCLTGTIASTSKDSVVRNTNYNIEISQYGDENTSPCPSSKLDSTVNAKSLCFSPFNSVKVIKHRTMTDDYMHDNDEYSEEGETEEEDDECYIDELEDASEEYEEMHYSRHIYYNDDGNVVYDNHNNDSGEAMV